MKYGIISDIHSDIVSFKKVIVKLEQHNIDQIFCCGDLVGYGNFPDAVVQLIIEKNIICVMGNHEKALFDEDEYEQMNPKAQKAINDNLDYLSDNELSYLKQLPKYYIHNNMRFVHGVPPNSYQDYLFYFDRMDMKNIFNSFPEQIAFCGHTHQPAWFESQNNSFAIEKNITINNEYKIEKDKKYIINVGSVSLPRRKTLIVENKKQVSKSEVSRNQFVIYDTEKQVIIFK